MSLQEETTALAQPRASEEIAKRLEEAQLKTSPLREEIAELRSELMKARLKEWQEEEVRRIAESKARASERSGIPLDHPKFEIAWRITWDRGHASGFDEVENIFDELADLIR